MTCNCEAPVIYHDGSYICFECNKDKTVEHLNQMGYDFKTDLKNYTGAGCLIHDWKKYESRTESYEFCETCNQKR